MAISPCKVIHIIDNIIMVVHNTIIDNNTIYIIIVQNIIYTGTLHPSPSQFKIK